MKSQSTLGFDEIVDTLSDLIIAITGFRGLFGGKFNLMSFLAWAISEYPRIKEAVDDFDTFWSQVKDLDSEEAKAVAAAIRAKVPADAVNEKVLNVITGLALSYSFVDGTVKGGENLFNYWKNI